MKDDGKRKEALSMRMDSPEGQMRKRLINWGGTLELCRKRQENMKKALRLKEESLSCGVFGEKLAAGYEREIEENVRRIEEILEEKRKLDEMIAQLDHETQRVLMMHYENGYGYEYIAQRMHISRATCFRIGKKAVETLLEMEEMEQHKAIGQ